MKSTVKLVFQDCATCKWGLSLPDIQKCADKLKLGAVEKMPFWAEGAAEIIKKADKQGVTIPFFECDGKYASSLNELAKQLGVTAKKQKDGSDGDSTKDK